MNSWNVIFLTDQNPPTKVVLLKRSPDKKFAPNYYTGVGGKVEKGETILESAYRELQEETGLTGIELTQFAKAVIDNTYFLYYFRGTYSKMSLPHSDDGELEWVNTPNLLQKEIIPTTLEVIHYWSKRNFAIQPFTISMKEIANNNGVSIVKVLKTSPGI
jgi:8-oxo-dGTP diphosphatase